MTMKSTGASGINSWTVYILECFDKTYYCGITNDIDKRLAAHNSGKGARYTKGRRPVILLYQEEASSKSSALKREYQIKQMSKKEKRELING